MLWQGCIHTYPDGDGEDPSEMTIDFQIRLESAGGERLQYYSFGSGDCYRTFADADVIPEARVDTRSSEGDGYAVVIEIADESNKVTHLSRTFSPEFGNGATLTVPYKFKARRYRVALWCEKISDGGTLFLSEDLESVTPAFSRGDTKSAIVCHANSFELNLTRYSDGGTRRMTVPVDMRIPMSRIQFVATDVEEFVAAQAQALAKGEKFTVTLSYSGSMAASFDVYSGEPADYRSGVSFSKDMPLLFSKYAIICSDMIWISKDEDIVEVTLTVFNSARIPVSKVGIPVQVARGCTTTVRGDLLTKYTSHTITVDNIWGDDIIIEL